MLIDQQFPQWRSLPVRHVAATGTVNAIFRIGDLYAARFPLQARDVDVVRRSLEAEARAAAELAGRTRFQTPSRSRSASQARAIRCRGRCRRGCPAPSPPTRTRATRPRSRSTWPSSSSASGSIPALGRTFPGPGRGGDLRDHDEWLDALRPQRGRCRRAPAAPDVAELRDLPRGDAADVMNHGDLMPGNVLVSGDFRRLAGRPRRRRTRGRGSGAGPAKRMAPARGGAEEDAARGARLR